AVTAHNTLTGGPSHGLSVVIAAAHISKGIGSAVGGTGQPPQDGGDHAAGGAHVGAEGGGGGAAHQTVVIDVDHSVIEPVASGYVHEGLRSLLAALFHEGGLNGHPGGGHLE